MQSIKNNLRNDIWHRTLIGTLYHVQYTTQNYFSIFVLTASNCVFWQNDRLVNFLSYVNKLLLRKIFDKFSADLKEIKIIFMLLIRTILFVLPFIYKSNRLDKLYLLICFCVNFVFVLRNYIYPFNNNSFPSANI